MKLIITEDLKKRIQYAAQNESIIAKDLLKKIDKYEKEENYEETKPNYFDSVRIKKKLRNDHIKIDIEISGCSHSQIEQEEENDKTYWLKKNRFRMDAVEWAAELLQDDSKYEDKDWEYFESAIIVTSQIKIKISDKKEDFIKAYNIKNNIKYREKEDSVLYNNSFGSETALDQMADFYIKNAGAKIIYAETETGEIAGRAILWNDLSILKSQNKINLIDMIETSFPGFIKEMITKKAEKKNYNYLILSHTEKQPFLSLKDTELKGLNGMNIEIKKDQKFNISIYKKLNITKNEPRPFEIISVMNRLIYDRETYELYISNEEIYIINSEKEKTKTKYIEQLGYLNYPDQICPICGHKRENKKDIKVCDQCEDKLKKETAFGTVISTKMTKYKNMKIPEQLLSNGKPTPHFKTYLTLKSIRY